jgi:eukaryotic-like serine/threonine-protein kinase
MSVDQRIADRYELRDVVGTGGMASVYCAYDTLLERNVALKILHDHHSEDDEYVERFRREARAAAQLSHPGIVTVIDRGDEGGRQFIVFEYVEGETLKELVERSGPMPVRRVIELALQIGRAIAFAHDQGLVHRDVKPQNVLLGPEGRAKVTDFGIARAMEAVGRTESGTVLGTSHYIAPEQARGEPVDAQTDVYSFGVVLYELLAGEVPYPGDNFLNVAMKHVNEPVPSLLERRPDCPLRLAGLVERMMGKEPEERPASMDEVVSELEACLADLDARPDGEATMIVKARVAKPSRPRADRPRRGRRALVVLLPLLAVAGAAAAFFVLRAEDGGAPAAETGAPVRLSGLAAYDPEGSGGEHDDEAGLATDGDPSTFWRTESYNSPLSQQKSGVGLVLDTRGAEVSTLTVASDTPGFTAEIRAGRSRSSFDDAAISESRTIGRETTFELEETDARYLLFWITEIESGSVHVNEVRAS